MALGKSRIGLLTSLQKTSRSESARDITNSSDPFGSGPTRANPVRAEHAESRRLHAPVRGARHGAESEAQRQE